MRSFDKNHDGCISCKIIYDDSFHRPTAPISIIFIFKDKNYFQQFQGREKKTKNSHNNFPPGVKTRSVFHGKQTASIQCSEYNSQ